MWPSGTRFIPIAPLAWSVELRDLLEAAIDFHRRWAEAGGSATPTGWGSILSNVRYPLVHMANLAWVDVVPPDGPGAILDDLDAAFMGTDVRHRRLQFADARSAYEVQEDLARRGFKPLASLAMAKVGLPACIVNPDVDVRPVVEATTEGDFGGIAAMVHHEFGYEDEESRQLLALSRERARLVDMRSFVAYLRGEPAGIVTLWPLAPVALVEDVATRPEFRMQGVGRTMIFQACSFAADAGCEYVLLMTDLSGVGHPLFKTLGFQPVGEVRGFLRP